jgi:hypothetical protein
MKKYFSKLYEKWMDFKDSDCEESLRKYEYKIREVEDDEKDENKK